MKEIAFITVSKGRLNHIQKTLPMVVRQGAAEVVVVDYDCPDRTGDWVEANFPDVTVVRASDDQGFCLARARNLGAARSRSEWLVFIDADIAGVPGWTEWMQQHLQPGHFYRASLVNGRPQADSYGTVICARADFELVGGYDEAYRGWGGEDDDLFDSLRRHGVVESRYPFAYLKVIRHSDAERAGWSGLGGKSEQVLLNQCYRAAKAQFAALAGNKPIPLAARLKLREQTRRMLAAWLERGTSEPTLLRYRLQKIVHECSPPYAMEGELVFAIRVTRQPEPQPVP